MSAARGTAGRRVKAVEERPVAKTRSSSRTCSSGTTWLAVTSHLRLRRSTTKPAPALSAVCSMTTLERICVSGAGMSFNLVGRRPRLTECLGAGTTRVSTSGAPPRTPVAGCVGGGVRASSAETSPSGGWAGRVSRSIDPIVGAAASRWVGWAAFRGRSTRTTDGGTRRGPGHGGRALVVAQVSSGAKVSSPVRAGSCAPRRSCCADRTHRSAGRPSRARAPGG